MSPAASERKLRPLEEKSVSDPERENLARCKPFMRGLCDELEEDQAAADAERDSFGAVGGAEFAKVGDNVEFVGVFGEG